MPSGRRGRLRGHPPGVRGGRHGLHLAANVFNDRDKQIAVDIGGTYNVFEAARRNGVERVVFASGGGTTLGWESESPYFEIVAAQYDKIPES